MAEPSYKRVRRPDSKQMWDEADRRNPTVPLPTRERDEPGRDDRRDDRRDNRRRYRSRSPRRDDRRRGDREKDRGGRRDDDDRSYRRRDRDGGRERDWRDKPRERSRDRKGNRSRSPGKDKERERDTEARRYAERNLKREDREKSRSLKPEDELTRSRTGTPPVNFKLGPGVGAQDHDGMDVDAGGRKGKDSAEATIEDYDEEEDDIIIEDDGTAALQAMMGFGGFATTQNQKVAGNDISAVRKEKKTEYRQYMNRQGGFNRPLSPTRE